MGRSACSLKVIIKEILRFYLIYGTMEQIQKLKIMLLSQ